ncbi:transglutaminase-like domain-containing protein [Xylocopilactobacillus apis]|uniref:Transglutaminase n=1 Tax=Xylocopilactobacillus apis TaxID=2932183 RepID=A0AAU9D5B5_9LACO|nr:transglutaminase-like domain-containing protein [Xylocopilactobacillus apis]BDR57455.1 transglutaminase [Xylocopilactobacillus apis]BDR57504.1 transglutaminase [Xylocopilactobacillus apis]
MTENIAKLVVPLPEDVLKLKNFGDFAGAEKLINFKLEKDISEILKERLRLELDILKVMKENEYPYDLKQAVEVMKENLTSYDNGELEELKDQGLVDWMYINGDVHFQRRFFLNLSSTDPKYKARLKQQENNEERQNELNDNVRLMKEKGSRKVKIRLRSSIKVKKNHERVGDFVRVHLPIPKDCQQVSEIKILRTTPEATVIAPVDSAQRTVCFETKLESNQEFSVEYEYVNQVNYVELDPKKAEPVDITSDLGEQDPHIRFTPFLKALEKEIIGTEQNPIKQARRIYDYVTTKVNYSYMREYCTIDNISEYAAVNQKGDCGVQALLFITLCRIAGIPSRWQSGLYVTKFYTGCHDWAQFYVAPYGWVFADLSFGGSSYRSNNLERWNYYFGNLDIYRMPANSEIQAPFTPEKKQFRADPVDNQRGEFEYVDEGMIYANLEVAQELISMQELD